MATEAASGSEVTDAPDSAANPDMQAPIDAVAPVDASATPDAAAADNSPEVAAPPQCVTASDCPAALACQLGQCSASGKCEYVAQADGSACSDGSLCTAGDACNSGACLPKGAVVCDDENPCTADKCNPLAGCINLPLAASSACDDGNPCTSGDACLAGKCLPGVATCQCQTHSDCAKFEDGDLCNGTLYCDKAAGPPYTCKVNPATVVACQAGGDTACAKTVCVPSAGQCKLIQAPANTPCSDGDKCTQGDFCEAGLCVAGTNACFCKKDADCADQGDGNACNGKLYCNKAASVCAVNPAWVVHCKSADDTYCSQNLCSPKDGKCHMTAVHEAKACDDGNACTPSETCASGSCKADANICECQMDADCTAKEDSNLCNGTLYCDVAKGRCVVNPKTVVACAVDDDPPCLRDTCDAKTGKCQEIALPKDGTACDDGNLCTPTSACQGGVCKASTNLCACQTDADCQAKEDGNLCNGTLYCHPIMHQCVVNPASVVSCPTVFDEACLTNQCDPQSAKCALKPAWQGSQCDDGGPCSGGGWCDGGSCAVEVKLACQCTASTDCAALEDGDLCNGTLYCDKSTSKPQCKVNPASIKSCQSVDDTACWHNTCQAKTGACALQAAAGACEDGKKCTVLDACQNGSCAGIAAFCDDSKPCTVDACLEPQGCVNLPAAASACNDGNACTNDGCSPQTGCFNTPTTALCSDGNACTSGDACQDGTCQTKAVNCSDANPCSDDSCDAKLGCQHVTNIAPCDDGNPCTKFDACSLGTCAGVFECDDGNPCTQDGCAVLGNGCVHLAVGPTPCDDGTVCTTGDTCKQGNCTGAALLNCDDGNACTSDACDKASGCYHYDSPLGCAAGGCTVDDVCKNGTCVAGATPRLTSFFVTSQPGGPVAFELSGGVTRSDGGLLAWGGAAGGYFGSLFAGNGWVGRLTKQGAVVWQVYQPTVGGLKLGHVTQCNELAGSILCFGQSQATVALAVRLKPDLGAGTVPGVTQSAVIDLGGSETRLNGAVCRPKLGDCVVALRTLPISPGPPQAHVLRLDIQTLAVLESATWKDEGGGTEWLGLQGDSDGVGVVAAGRTWQEPTPGAPDPLVARYGATFKAGAKQAKQLAVAGYDWARTALPLAGGGLLLVGGRYKVGLDKADMLVQRLDAGFGLLWEKTVGDPGGHDEALGAAQQADGSVLVAGMRHATGEAAAALLRFNGAGLLIGQAQGAGVSESVAYAILPLPGGDWLALGRAYPPATNANAGLLWRIDGWLNKTCAQAGACGQAPVTVGPPCAWQTCAAGKVQTQSLATNDPCSDGNACTNADTCGTTGNCAGQGVVCDDGNPCTLETCDKAVGCIYSPVGDGVACGAGLVCKAAVCGAN